MCNKYKFFLSPTSIFGTKCKPTRKILEYGNLYWWKKFIIVTVLQLSSTRNVNQNKTGRIKCFKIFKTCIVCVSTVLLQYLKYKQTNGLLEFSRHASVPQENLKLFVF